MRGGTAWGTDFAPVLRVPKESAVRIALQPERHDDHVHLRHQGLWFILLVVVMSLLLSKRVATLFDGQPLMCHRVQQYVDPDRVAFH